MGVAPEGFGAAAVALGWLELYTGKLQLNLCVKYRQWTAHNVSRERSQVHWLKPGMELRKKKHLFRVRKKKTEADLTEKHLKKEFGDCPRCTNTTSECSLPRARRLECRQAGLMMWTEEKREVEQSMRGHILSTHMVVWTLLQGHHIFSDNVLF